MSISCRQLTTYFANSGKNPLKHYYYKCTTTIKHGALKCPSRLVPARDLEVFSQRLMIHTARNQGFFESVTSQIKDNSDDELNQLNEERHTAQEIGDPIINGELWILVIEQVHLVFWYGVREFFYHCLFPWARKRDACKINWVFARHGSLYARSFPPPTLSSVAAGGTNTPLTAECVKNKVFSHSSKQTVSGIPRALSRGSQRSWEAWQSENSEEEAKLLRCDNPRVFTQSEELETQPNFLSATILVFRFNGLNNY